MQHLVRQVLNAVVLEQLNPKHHLMAGLMYGGGMRLMECITLRAQDIDFDYRQITIRNAKGFKDTHRDSTFRALLI